MDPYSGTRLIARAFRWNGDMEDLVNLFADLYAESFEEDKPENEWALRVVCQALLERPGLPDLYRAQCLVFLSNSEKGDILAIQERLQAAKRAVHRSMAKVCPAEFDTNEWVTEEKKLAKTIENLIELTDVAHAEALAAPDGVQPEPPEQPQITVQPPEESEGPDTSEDTKNMEELQLSGTKEKDPDTTTKAGGLKPYPVLGSMRRNAPPNVRRKQSNQFFLGQGIAPAMPIRPGQKSSHAFKGEPDKDGQQKDREGKEGAGRE